jgi:hypothetical protein
MRALILIPIVVIAVAAGGYAMVHALGDGVELRSLLVAGIGSLLAGELAAIPLLLTRHSAQPAVAQAGLIGTLVHMMGNLGIAAVVLLGKMPVGSSFVYWLMAFYFPTLIVLVIAFAKALKSAPVAEAPRA